MADRPIDRDTPPAHSAPSETAGAVLADTLAQLVEKLKDAAGEDGSEGPGADVRPATREAPSDDRRAIQVAAAGRHHAIVLSDLPVLRLVHELPELWREPTREEADIRTIHSLARLKAET